MQPGVIVALATVWLAVAAGVVGAVTPRPLRLSDDQYSPASPRRHGVQRDRTDWRDHEPPEDQPLDLWIGSRRSIFAEDSPDLSRNVERDLALGESLKNVALPKQVHESSGWQKIFGRLPNIAYTEFMLDKVDYSEMPETLSRTIPPSDPLDDPFVADDTFQDQGPGSVEIYKLDLSKEKALLTATTPSTRLPARNKSKAPKKTGRVNSKTKTMEIKSTTSPKTHHRQSNFFEEQRTETPVNGRDAFDIGGVPELQVGCEGLEASSSYKAKRSLREETAEESMKQLHTLLDYDYELYDDENYEEIDELFKLKKLETTTSGIKSNRGDMDATLDSDHVDIRRPDRLPVRGDLGESNAVPQQGLANSSDSFNLTRLFLDAINSSETYQNESPEQTDSMVKGHEETKAKREPVTSDGDSPARRSGRRLLWLAEANTEGFAGDGQKRAKRSTDWGFGEDEGVVSSNELQTINERRRQHDMRYHQDAWRRDQRQEGPNSEVDTIRREYERLLEHKQREEEERRRRMQEGDQRTPNGWVEEERRRTDEMRRREYEEHRRRTEYTSTPRTYDEEARRRRMEELRRRETSRDRTQETARRDEEEKERRLREEEELKRRPHDRRQDEERKRRQEENAKRLGYKTSVSDEEGRRRLQDEEMRRRTEERRRQEDERRRAFDEDARRQEQYRSQQEAQRRRKEEEKRRASQEKRRQEDEEEKRRQQDRDRNETPSNLMRAGHRVGHPNDLEQRDRDRRMREQEERVRYQKLREYMARNRPINANQTGQRSENERRGYRPEQTAGSRANENRDDDEYRRRAEEQRRRQEEERKLQDYIRRNQPVNVPSRGNQSIGRNWFDERRQIEGARRRHGYPDPGATRRRGPSAPTYIDPRSSLEEVRWRQEASRLEEERRQARERQQRYEAEERRKELARRQQQEEEERRRLQEERRQEEVRREEEARREQSRRYQENRERLEAARIQAERSRQETLLRERGRVGGQAATGRTRQPETTRSPYQNPRLVEHRMRQDSRPIPSNLARDEARWAVERERQRQEQARHGAERRWQEESRIREQRPTVTYTDQGRRQEIARLHSLPVSAKIILRSSGPTPTNPSSVVISRADFGNEIDFTGINPNREGLQVAQFPVAPTTRPPVQSPGPCVWAVVQCCSRNNNRLVKCFESMGCPGINWDSNPCRYSIVEAARKEVMKFYAAAENQ